MSKKKKFKKFSKGSLLNQIDKPNKTDIIENVEINDKKDTPSKSNISQYDNEELKYVKSDLKKVAFVFSSVILLLVVVTVIQKQTPWLSHLSENLTVLFNLN